MTRIACLYRYDLPFRGGEKLNMPVEKRCGLIARLEENNNTGLGEIAPLPRFSRESLEDAVFVALDLLNRWQKGNTIDALLEDTFPSVAFGVSCALSELSGALPKTYTYRSATLLTCREIDAFITGVTGSPSLSKKEEPLKPSLVKIKVGRDDPQKEARAVTALLEAMPFLTLRLDANRAWQLKDALRFARYIDKKYYSSIAFIEEPCETPETSLDFARQSNIKIAWDEHLRDDDFNPLRDHAPFVVAWVIKPTLIGSITRCRALIRHARQRGIGAITGSSYESSLGLSLLARFAAWATPHDTPGLDTGDAFDTCIARGFPSLERAALPLSALEKIS